jgi:transcriptional regulator with XRE-family HTH domain
MMIAARLLNYARRAARMSQRALSLAAEIPQSTISRIERGRVSPRIETLERLLQATGRGLTTERRLGIGVDRSQIREMLRLSPGDRARLAAEDAANLPFPEPAMATSRELGELEAGYIQDVRFDVRARSCAFVVDVTEHGVVARHVLDVEDIRDMHFYNEYEEPWEVVETTSVVVTDVLQGKQVSIEFWGPGAGIDFVAHEVRLNGVVV